MVLVNLSLKKTSQYHLIKNDKCLLNGSCKLAAKLGKPNKKIQPNLKHEYTIML